jgi:hypothetical protein
LTLLISLNNETINHDYQPYQNVFSLHKRPNGMLARSLAHYFTAALWPSSRGLIGWFLLCFLGLSWVTASQAPSVVSAKQIQKTKNKNADYAD